MFLLSLNWLEIEVIFTELKCHHLPFGWFGDFFSSTPYFECTSVIRWRTRFNCEVIAFGWWGKDFRKVTRSTMVLELWFCVLHFKKLRIIFRKSVHIHLYLALKI